MALKNSFPVTHPDIFRLGDQNCTNIVVEHLGFYFACSQSALHVTDDSHIKDVFQLKTVIVMTSSAKKNYMTPKV